MHRLAFCLAFFPTLSQADDGICTHLANYIAGEAAVPYNAQGAECKTSMVLGGAISKDCAWRFDYRAEAAGEFFATILKNLEFCALEITLDAPEVSHPDSYDLHQFNMDGATLSVSLKDKGALSETYVFFRAADRSP